MRPRGHDIYSLSAQLWCAFPVACHIPRPCHTEKLTAFSLTSSRAFSRSSSLRRRPTTFQNTASDASLWTAEPWRPVRQPQSDADLCVLDSRHRLLLDVIGSPCNTVSRHARQEKLLTELTGPLYQVYGDTECLPETISQLTIISSKGEIGDVPERWHSRQPKAGHGCRKVCEV